VILPSVARGNHFHVEQDRIVDVPVEVLVEKVGRSYTLVLTYTFLDI
jgi:hypothetical protein